jgi:hypothetical protein
MHRYRIVARISLILFTLNLVLAAPAVVREIHEARADGMVVAEPSSSYSPHDGVTETTQGGVAGASHDGEAGPSHDGEAGPSHDAMASPHSSLDDPTPHLSFDSSLSGHSWLLNRPILSPDSQSSHDSDTPPSPSPPTETPPDNAEHVDETVTKKVKLIGFAVIIGGAIAAVVGTSLSKNHNKQRDFEYSST